MAHNLVLINWFLIELYAIHPIDTLYTRKTRIENGLPVQLWYLFPDSFPMVPADRRKKLLAKNRHDIQLLISTSSFRLLY